MFIWRYAKICIPPSVPNRIFFLLRKILRSNMYESMDEKKTYLEKLRGLSVSRMRGMKKETINKNWKYSPRFILLLNEWLDNLYCTIFHYKS